MYVSLYENAGDARADLEAIEDLHRDELIGTFDAAVVENEKGKAHVVKRLDRPMVRDIPEWIGFGPLSRKELKGAATELTGTEAGLVMIGEPTLEKAFNKAVTHASKTVKRAFDATADELAQEMKEAVGS